MIIKKNSYANVLYWLPEYNNVFFLQQFTLADKRHSSEYPSTRILGITGIKEIDA